MAKVGRRIPGPEPLPPITWRDNLHDFARATLIMVAVIGVCGLVIAIVSAVK